MSVSFQNQSIVFTLKHKGLLKEWISEIILNEKRIPGTINFLFTNDNTVLAANQKYLNHNTFTDIITFDYTEGKILNADILISIERVTENAKKFNSQFEKELHRVIIHGVLHLCGYKDKTKKDQALMRDKEEKSLKHFSKLMGR